ncbi:hypothetical protein N7492_000496, partial [Penicillium capsulatum]
YPSPFLAYQDYFDQIYGSLIDNLIHFPNFTDLHQFDGFFKAFNLSWRRGDYYRETFQINRSCIFPTSIQPSSLLNAYSMKALHVKVLELQRGCATTESLAFPPMEVDQSQAAVVAARIGEGTLVYCGDVNGAPESHALMMALCGFKY